ncbi:MAG: hypothetical protein GY757_51685 [bacterium]|nr:hypothetical protein [bacterium]
MRKKLYALLVGINEYPQNVPNLKGCLNDVNHMQRFLKNNFNAYIETLLNRDATRGNIVEGFNQHLGKATENDVVLFYFSGHGSQARSAAQFESKWDETLVCSDSRKPGGFDLADKELAALLKELSKKNPHIAVILDCCHSGSGTREAGDFLLGGVRQTEPWEPGKPRPIETYLDGYYAQMETITVPHSKHLLMAACDKTQKARETKTHRGLFTLTLQEVLSKAKTPLSYADLFVKCRHAILKRTDSQTPQFEPHLNFLPNTKFLDGAILSSPAKYFVSYNKDNKWEVDAGALHGFPTQPEKITRLALYPDETAYGAHKNKATGYAETLSVGAQKSILEMEPQFAYNKNTSYKASVISLPVPPLPVLLEGESEVNKLIQNALKKEPNFIFTDDPAIPKYKLVAHKGRLQLFNKETGLLIQAAEGEPEPCIEYIFSIIEQVITWERGLALQNHGTAFNPGDVDFTFFEEGENETPFEYKGDEISLNFIKKGDRWQEIRGKLRVRNRTNQELYLTLIYFSEQFEIRPYKLDHATVKKGNKWVTVWGDADYHYIDLQEGIDEETDIFKLIVSTEPVDSFLLAQEEVELGETFYPGMTRSGDTVDKSSERGIGRESSRKKIKLSNEWFVKTLTFRTVRQLNRVSQEDAVLADGQVIVKGHPKFTANLSISGNRVSMRGVEHGLVSKVFDCEDLRPLSFSVTRGEVADEAGVLELTEISNAASLKENPLQIQLDTQLGSDEYVLPLTYDGNYFLPVGQTSIGKNGKVVVSVDYLPEKLDTTTRSLTGSLKMYFYKYILRRKQVNQLSWVGYGVEGEMVRLESGLKEKVAGAGNILLLVHGIIGDTEPMARGLGVEIDEQGQSLADRYDLVLTYDYENLHTSIEKTARLLMAALEEVGISRDKRVTVLAHSMGGLVSRWMIEREGGDRLVKHLVMAGTPNNGSAFGEITAYRDFAVTALTLSLNLLKPLILCTSSFLLALKSSEEITRTLGQMRGSSDFITTLNISDDPGVQYTVLAGDITHYEVDKKGFFAGLLEKVELGVGELVYTGPNDIAVAVESIKGVKDLRKPTPRKMDLVCHHLNYFDSEAGIEALKQVL